jgi:hypothetical protein
MGLSTKYILSNQDGIDQEFPDAYLKVVKVNTASVDYEFFEPVSDPENPTITERLSWVNRLESHATVYVWGDSVARNNRAYQIHWFSFTFNYDLESDKNIYQQAYDKLKILFENSKDN